MSRAKTSDWSVDHCLVQSFPISKILSRGQWTGPGSFIYKQCHLGSDLHAIEPNVLYMHAPSCGKKCGDALFWLPRVIKRNVFLLGDKAMLLFQFKKNFLTFSNSKNVYSIKAAINSTAFTI